MKFDTPEISKQRLPADAQLPARAVDWTVVPFEAVLEEIRQRQETKTKVLDEALQHAGNFPQRFWGINE